MKIDEADRFVVGEVIIASGCGAIPLTGGQPGLVQWSRQQGYVYLADQELPIVYTR